MLVVNPHIEMLSVNGVKPSKETIRNGTYPLNVYTYAVTLKSNKKWKLTNIWFSWHFFIASLVNSCYDTVILAKKKEVWER